MTAQIILFPRWRASLSSQLPSGIEAAIEHLIWLRTVGPQITPETAALMVDRLAATWADVIVIYAELWESLPEIIRREV
jgi:hypothetical protein